MKAETFLSCNGWNHPKNCDCGWGGDTGGRGAHHFASPHSTTRPSVITASGLDWHGRGHTILESFVNPNAKCPVCGDEVFFYQSPEGGRVFFDELGPPWPKHPCTDRAFNNSASAEVEPIAFRFTQIEPTGFVAPTQWQPLLHWGWRTIRDWDVFRIDPSKFDFAGEEIVVSAGNFRDRPIYWRVNLNDPTLLDISSFDVDDHHDVVERIETVPSWIVGFDEKGLPEISDPMPFQVIYTLAKWISFAWEGRVENWPEQPWIDLDLASKLFERAAKAGHVDSKIALGRMYQKGFGVETNPVEAYRLFRDSAEMRDGKRAMYFLSECYAKGLGVDQNPEQAEYWKNLHKRSG